MAKKTRVKLPVFHRVTRKIFPAIERYLPGLADRLTVEFFFRPMRFKPTQQEETSLLTAQKQFIEIAGKKILVYYWGEGKPVLMAHGWMGRGTQFRKFIKPFNENGFKVVSFDGPAHGRSNGRKTHIGEFKDVIFKLQDIHGPFEATIGHSFGGAVNMYCRLKGLAVKKMILISSPSVADDILENYLSIINGHVERLDYFRSYVRKQYNVEFNDITTYVMSEKIPPIPMLLIHDQDDTDAPIRHARILQSKLQYPTLIETKGLGHNRILKDRSVIDSCLEFVQNTVTNNP